MKKIILLTSVLALAACEKSIDLKGRNFVSTSESGTEITLSFDETDKMVNGKVVNLYHGSYEIHGNKIKFGPFASTMMMGPMEAMNTEQEYFKFMETVSTYEYANDSLILRDTNNKEMIFKQQASVTAD